MDTFLNLSQLSRKQLQQYTEAKLNAFPPVINCSDIIAMYWVRLEEYFPECQHIMIGVEEEVVGFINTLPFDFEKPLDQLPQEGWDWMLAKSISDYEDGLKPNYLGALQVIVRKQYQNQGYSKILLNYIKEQVRNTDFLNLIIPIRPTLKHLYPHMPMDAYLNLRDGDQVYDPWIRAHLNGGAQVISVCENSMTIRGNLSMWGKLFEEGKILTAGDYLLPGALTPVSIDVENNFGEYVEPNIWIKYE